MDSLGHVVHPAHGPVHHRAVVPVEMGDGRPAPGEGRIGIRADQRDLSRCEDSVLSEMVLGGVEEERLVNDQGRGRSDAKQFVQQAVKPLGRIVPIRGGMLRI